MNKVPNDAENPLDKVILQATSHILPVFRATHHTPNTITTYSFLCGLAAVWFLAQGCVGAFVLLYSAAYVFDCMDGQFARRYGMTSTFGDLYDHVTDLIVYSLVCAVVLRKLGARRSNGDIAVMYALLLVALLGLLVNAGCAQRVHRLQQPDRQTETLDALQGLCPCEDWVSVTRYFPGWCRGVRGEWGGPDIPTPYTIQDLGFGTFNAIFLGIIIYLYRT